MQTQVLRKHGNFICVFVCVLCCRTLQSSHFNAMEAVGVQSYSLMGCFTVILKLVIMPTICSTYKVEIQLFIRLHSADGVLSIWPWSRSKETHFRIQRSQELWTETQLNLTACAVMHQTSVFLYHCRGT